MANPKGIRVEPRFLASYRNALDRELRQLDRPTFETLRKAKNFLAGYVVPRVIVRVGFRGWVILTRAEARKFGKQVVVSNA